MPLPQLVAESAGGRVVVLNGASRPGELTVDIRAVSDSHLPVAEIVADAAATGARRVRFADGITDVPVSGGLGRPGAPDVAGPAFLAARDTTVFVPAGWTAEFDTFGFGIVRRRGDRG